MRNKIGKIILFSIVFGSLVIFVIFSNSFFGAFSYGVGYGNNVATPYTFGFYLSVAMLIVFVISFIAFWLLILKDKKIKTKVFMFILPITVLFVCTLFNMINMTSGMGAGFGNYTNRISVGITSMPINIIIITCVSAVYLGILFVVLSLLLNPIKKVQGAVVGLASGHTDKEIRIGGSSEMQTIEAGLEKINDNLKQNKEMLGKLNNEYSKYLPDQFVKQLGKKSILDLSLGCNIQKEVTSVFIDIRNSTKTSLTLSLAENFAFINRYLGIIGPIVRSNEGFIDKYLGDGVLAVFTNADVAMKASTQIVKKIRADSDELGILGVEVKIGIHTGEVVMGVIGEKKRLNATIISETVNIASHLEKMNRKLGTQILFTKDTLNKMQRSKCNYRYVGTLQLSEAKAENISVFENIDVYKKEKQNNLIKTKSNFESAIRSYESGGSKARELLCKCIEIEPTDVVAKLYLSKIKAPKIKTKKGA